MAIVLKWYFDYDILSGFEPWLIKFGAKGPNVESDDKPYIV